MKSTVINQPFKLASRSANIDSIYGPYKSIKEALDNVPLEYRAIGRTLAILENGSLSEYQFKKGVRDEDLELKSSGGSEDVEVTWESISGKPAVIASGTTQAAARTSIGAGTSNLAIGTTSTTAAAGNHTHTQYASTTHNHTVSNITDISDVGKSVIMAPTMAGAREAIGAGTGNSNLTIGTTATTAKAGNYHPTWAQVTGKPTDFTPSSHTHAWADITGKPSTFTPTVGTTATTAKAGNYTPSATEIVNAIEAMTPEQVIAVQTKLGITPAAE